MAAQRALRLATRVLRRSARRRTHTIRRRVQTKLLAPGRPRASRDQKPVAAVDSLRERPSRGVHGHADGSGGWVGGDAGGVPPGRAQRAPTGNGTSQVGVDS